MVVYNSLDAGSCTAGVGVGATAVGVAGFVVEQEVVPRATNVLRSVNRLHRLNFGERRVEGVSNIASVNDRTNCPDKAT
jgi:hypothetical protein